VKTAAFVPGRVGPLPTYLGYLFLRFPGSLGAEETHHFECLDTYDGRWSRQGQIWIREGQVSALVTPPGTFALSTDLSAFGLQKPLLLGRVTLRLRHVAFESDQGFVEGQVVRFRTQSWFVLRGRDEAFESLTRVLEAEGLEPAGRGVGWMVSERAVAFMPPAAWPPLRPDESAAAALTARLADGFRMARQYEKGVRDDVDTECLHHYRVSLRRARSLLSLGRLWETIPEWDRLKLLLGQLQTATNELRDLDVLLLDLPGLRAKVPWGEGTHLAAWEASMAQRRRAEYRKVRAWLMSEAYASAAAEVTELIAALTSMGAPWTAEELAARTFERAAGGLRKILRRLPSDTPDETLHDVRIRAKKLRYALEGLGSLGHQGSVRTLAAALKETQEALGKFQDRSVLLERLKTGLAGARSGKTDPLAYVLLVGVIAGDHDRRKAEARASAKRLRSKPVLRALDRLANRSETGDGE